MRSLKFLSSIGIATVISVAAGLQHAPRADQQARQAPQDRQAERPAPPAAHTHARQNPLNDVQHLVAVLHPTQGNEQIAGTAHFEQLSGGRVRIVVEVEGLEPGGVHAIHVHEYGDCTADDATSAGGHYNPEGHDHKLPEHGERHAGDLGNLPPADDQGRTHYELTVDNITLAGNANPVIGRAVIVHESHDTGRGETGEAGGRILCGVIGIANPDTDTP